ncbi:MAG: AzlD domain-containing protein [Treponema sp.]|nr:AzlD domain-containing protein [Treponema sp.]
MSSTATVVLTIILTSLLLLFYRGAPFMIFSKREPPKALKFVEKCLPPLIIATLIVYCLKDINYAARPWGTPQFIAIAATVLLHLWKRNSMVSIFGGTILFMVLSRVF